MFNYVITKKKYLKKCDIVSLNLFYKFEQPSLGFFKEEEEKKSLIHTENLCLKPFF